MLLNLVLNIKKISLLCETGEDDVLFGENLVGEIGRKGFLKLIRKNDKEQPLIEEVWKKRYAYAFFQRFWLISFQCTKETRLIVLQWKILHDIYPTGTLLKKMKLKENDLCKFCDMRDTPLHFFFECKSVSGLWHEVKKIITCKTGITLSLDSKEVLLGVLPKPEVKTDITQTINLIILIGKLAISKGKYGKASNFLYILEHELSIRNLF